MLFPKYLGVASRRNFLSRERYEIIEQATMYTKFESVEGDYLEFGVATGRSLIFAYLAAKKFGTLDDTRFYGFDSFEGFPEPKGVDKVFERFKEGEVSYGISVVKKNLKLYCPNYNEFVLVEGWYDKTLKKKLKKKENLTKAKIINIDCDLYGSTIPVLNFITSLVQNGTVILFDDWLSYRADPKKGEQRATKEWLEKNPRIELVPYRPYANVGQSFIVNIKEQNE